MEFRMMFGTVVSGALAYGVLRVFGVFRGQAGLFEIGAGVLLSGLYLALFWSGVTGSSSRKTAPELRQVTWSESEFEEMQKAEALQRAA